MPPKDKNRDVIQGTLDMLILKIVALGPIHGYAISQRIQQISKDYFQLQQGSLYPALHRLENRGWLAADWRATDTGRDAKFYKLTAKGRKQLEADMESWERIFANTLSMRFSLTHVQVEVMGDLAWVVLTENIDSSNPDGRVSAQVQATNIFQRQGDRWLVVHHHGSPVSPAFADAEPDRLH